MFMIIFKNLAQILNQDVGKMIQNLTINHSIPKRLNNNSQNSHVFQFATVSGKVNKTIKHNFSEIRQYISKNNKKYSQDKKKKILFCLVTSEI